MGWHTQSHICGIYNVEAAHQETDVKEHRKKNESVKRSVYQESQLAGISTYGYQWRFILRSAISGRARKDSPTGGFSSFPLEFVTSRQRRWICDAPFGI